jgi:histidinol-phosphate aminotransferase
VSNNAHVALDSLLSSHVCKALTEQPPFVKRARLGVLNLSSNELLHPDLAQIFAAFTSVLSEQVHLARYPVFEEAMEMLCAEASLPNGSCALSPGSDAAIRAVIESFSRAGRVITLVPCYRGYKDYSAVFGCSFVGVELHPEISGLARLIDAVRRNEAAIVVLTNPDGFTGHLWEIRQASELATEAMHRGSLVILDEAYAAFAPIDHIALLADHPNIIIIRSYSKSHGSAGIRLAAVFAQPWCIDVILRTRVSNGLSSVAIAFLKFVLANEEIYARLRDDVARWRASYELRLRTARPEWDVACSKGNFIFARLPSLADTKGLQTELGRICVEVKAVAMSSDLPTSIRATVAHPTVMERAMTVLAGDAP